MKTFTALMLAAATALTASAATPASFLNNLASTPTTAVGLERAKSFDGHKAIITEKNNLVLNSKRTVTPMANEEVTYIFDVDFSFLKNGSLTSPETLELDDEGNIPESLIGAANYGFGSHDLLEAGGVLYLPGTYRDAKGQEVANFMWSPDVNVVADLTVSMDIRVADGFDPEDTFTVQAVTSEGYYVRGNADITDEWKTCTFQMPLTQTNIPTPYYFQMYAKYKSDVLIKNIKVYGVIPPVSTPKPLPPTNYQGTSFICNWQPAQGATSYLLTVAVVDPNTREILEYVFTEKEVTETSYLLTGLDPEKVYAYFVAATDGDYVTPNSPGVLVDLLTTTNNINVVANTGEKLSA